LIAQKTGANFSINLIGFKILLELPHKYYSFAEIITIFFRKRSKFAKRKNMLGKFDERSELKETRLPEETPRSKKHEILSQDTTIPKPR